MNLKHSCGFELNGYAEEVHECEAPDVIREFGMLEEIAKQKGDDEYYEPNTYVADLQDLPGIHVRSDLWKGSYYGDYYPKALVEYRNTAATCKLVKDSHDKTPKVIKTFGVSVSHGRWQN